MKYKNQQNACYLHHFIAELTFFFAYICRMADHFLSTSLWNWLEEGDRSLFYQINGRFHNAVFDLILPYFRDGVFWAPLYIFLLAFMTLNYGKKGWWWSLGFICTVAIADLTGARIKELIERPRPCWDPEMIQPVRLLAKHCVQSFSFVSNHAANHFGIAAYVSITLYPLFRRWIYVIYIWAFFISYAQIYVGVHYPLDILGGAALGTISGLLTANIFRDKAGSFVLHK